MKRRTFVLCLLLGLTLVLAHCAPTPAPTGPGVHLLVEMEPGVRHKRPGWRESLPLSFGAALDSEDTLQATPEAHGMIVCADLSLYPLPPGYQGALPCRQVNGDDLVLRRRERKVEEDCSAVPSDLATPENMAVVQSRVAWVRGLGLENELPVFWKRTQPTEYRPHDPARCPACQARKDEGGQEGVAGLLAGDRLSIVPEGFEQIHHRLIHVRWRPIKQALSREQGE